MVADWACVAPLSVSYKNHRSRRLRRAPGEPQCDVAPRAAAARAGSRRAGGSVEALTRAVEGALR